MLDPIRVAITGATSGVSLSLLPMIARGDVFGEDQPLILQLFDVTAALNALEALVIELEDSCLSLVIDIIYTDDPAICFKDANVAFLMTSVKTDINRSIQLRSVVEMAKIFGEAMNKYANKNCKILNLIPPIHTITLVAMHYAPNLKPQNFVSCNRLDLNRALAYLAQQLEVSPLTIRNVVVWGNRSKKGFPDITHAYVHKIGRCLHLVEAVEDPRQLHIGLVWNHINREKIICQQLGSPPWLSNARAAAMLMSEWWNGNNYNITSAAILSDGSYDTTKNVFYSLPVRIVDGRFEVIKCRYIDWYLRRQLEENNDELHNERAEAIAICNRLDNPNMFNWK